MAAFMAISPPSVVVPSPACAAVLISRLPPSKLVSIVEVVIKEYPAELPAEESVESFISISSGSIK